MNEDSVKFNLALLDFKAFISSSVYPVSRKIMIGVNSIHSIGRLRSRSLCSVRCGRDFSVMDPFRYTKAPRSRSLKPLDFPDLLGKVQDGQNHPQTRKKKQKVTLVNCRICPWKCISSFFFLLLLMMVGSIFFPWWKVLSAACFWFIVIVNFQLLCLDTSVGCLNGHTYTRKGQNCWWGCVL